MTSLQIKGGTELHGRIQAAGAKNAMTKLLVATLLSDKKCVFYNVPDIGDVQVTVRLCSEIGADISWNKEKKILSICTSNVRSSYISQEFSGANRIPILMIGALLGRSREDVIIPTVGGCDLGTRPVDFHINALERLGACIELRKMHKGHAYFAHAYNGLHGALIELPYPSVGATENTILAAVRATGTTIIKNAAIEPEIVDLILFLQKLGAHITLEVDRTIKIQGVRKFYEVEHYLIPDRIEVASIGMAAIGTRGRVFIEGARHDHMITFLNKLREIGGGFSVHPEGIEFFYDGPLQGGIHLETDVHPGFMTDWQQPFATLLTQATGPSVLHETVYEKRFGFTEALIEMGADISLFKQCLGGRLCRFNDNKHYHSAVIKGPTPLTGKTITIPDLRGGFAYIMAALIASGESIVHGIHFIERGYEHLLQKFQSLGADIQKIEEKVNDLVTQK